MLVGSPKDCLPSLFFMHQFANKLVKQWYSFSSYDELSETFVTCRYYMENNTHKYLIFHFFSHVGHHCYDIFNTINEFFHGVSLDSIFIVYNLFCKNVVFYSLLMSNPFLRISHIVDGSSLLVMYFNKLSFTTSVRIIIALVLLFIKTSF